MSIETKSIFSDFLNPIRDMFVINTIPLNRFQYAHVLDKDTGKVTLHEGPQQLRLRSHHQIVGGIRNKIIVSDHEFAIILNPFNPTTGNIVEGEREIRVGPTIFALHPGEELEEDDVKPEYVLNDNEALLIFAVKDAPHPLQTGQTLTAGEKFLLRGPGRYIPHKDIQIVERRKSISLSEAQGVYVQNTDTGVVRVMTGPIEFFLEPQEFLWEKFLTQEELQALGYEAQPETAKEIRVLSSTPRPRRRASEVIFISLEDNEAIYLYDGEQVRVVFGPNTVYLNPNERPKVLFLSGGIPVRPNILRIAKLSLGPDFIRDSVMARTRDNATLHLDVTYRWRFSVNPEHPEKLFVLKDFVGFVAQTLSSEIRGEAARHDFEKFHVEAGSLITKAVFGGKSERYFEENGLIVFGIDVEKVTPKEDKISETLSKAIMTNVEIYTQTAREKANLAREQELIEGKANNEEARQRLLDLEAINERRRQLAEAQTERETAMMHIQTAAESDRIKAEAEAAVQRIKAEADAEAHRIRAQAEIQAETERLRAVAVILETPGGQAYIQLEQARVLRTTDKVIIPTDSTIYLGTNGFMK